MSKNPFLSNWITIKKVKNRDYFKIHNHLTGITYKMGPKITHFLRQLDGKKDPYLLLKDEMDLTRRESSELLEALKEEGLIRYNRKVPGLVLGWTLIRIYHSERYEKIAKVLVILFALSFIPAVLMGIIGLKELVVQHFFSYLFLESVPGQVIGFVLGIILGFIVHESGHAVAGIAFKIKVMEFGVMFRFGLAAYTLMDLDTGKSRFGKAVSLLAGTLVNLEFAALCIWICSRFHHFQSVFYMMGFMNFLMFLVNLMLMRGLDGMGTLGVLLGREVITAHSIRYLASFLLSKEFRKREAESGIIEAQMAVMLLITHITLVAYILYVLSSIFGW